MPMDFPDMESLECAAKVWKFRTVNEGEAEDQYRTALANHVELNDKIESMEIRTGHGWDKFTDAENLDMILRYGNLQI